MNSKSRRWPHQPAISLSRLAMPLLAVVAIVPVGKAATMPQGCVTTYSSSSSTICNSANTQWVCTETKTCTTVCTSTPSGLKAGVLYGPVMVGPPAVHITDMLGNPVVVSGTVLQLVPSPNHTAEAQALYGTLSTDHAWQAYGSNVDLPSLAPGQTGSVTFLITYTWPVPVLQTGAVWFSDDGDDRYGFHVTDTLELLGRPATAVAFGSGCGSLDQAATRPVLGTTLQLTLTNVPAGSTVGAVMLGSALTPGIELSVIGMPGCFLNVDPHIGSVPIPLSGSTGTLALGVPSNPGTIGFQFAAQGAVIALGLNPLGVLMSNGMALTIGN